MKNIRTADALRPRDFDDIVGQEHLFGKNLATVCNGKVVFEQ